MHDPAGVALLDTPSAVSQTGGVPIDFTPVVSQVGGLVFTAIPITVGTDIQRDEKNQVILVLILVVVALSGAFMLVRSVQRQTELAQMKVQLLSRVTHELKTPLAVIKMYGETLGLYFRSCCICLRLP